NKYSYPNNTELNLKVFRASNKVYINIADYFKRPTINFRIEEETEEFLSDKHMSTLGIFSEHLPTDLNLYEDLSSSVLKEVNPITYLNRYNDLLYLKDHEFLVENN
ncbi:hypothetical protein HZS_2472, partial [Henneguya salminicola]